MSMITPEAMPKRIRWTGTRLASYSKWTMGVVAGVAMIAGSLHKMNRNKFLICFGLLLLILLVSSYVLANDFQKSNPGKLYLVKRIYLGEIQSALTRDPFKSYLKQELEAKGFSIVDDVTNADAILKGTIVFPIVEDDWPGYMVLYDTLEFSLDSPTKESIWHGKVKVESKPDPGKNVTNRARKLAERIERDWKKSAKKAGIRH